MATEKAQRIMFDEAGFEPLDKAEPLGAADHTGTEAGGTLIVLEQERQQMAVRDLNGKLGQLESNVSRLSSAFGQSQQTINNTLLDIQRRSARMNADILALTGNVDSNSQQQAQAAAALEARLKAGMKELHEQLGRAGQLLQGQQGRLEQLESGQQSLLKLHDGVAALGRQHGDAIQALSQQTHQQGRQLHALGNEARKQAEALQALGNDSVAHGESIKALNAGQRQQGDALRALTSEAREQLQLNRSNIDGLRALHREQKQALQALAADYTQLNTRTDSLADSLHSLTAEVAQDRQWVRKGFQNAAGALAAVAVVILAVMAYCQWHPVAVPDTVRSQLATLNTLVSRQTAAQQSMATEMLALQGRINAIGASSDAQSTEMAQMQKEMQHSVSVLHRIRKSEAAIHREMSGLESRLGQVEQASPKPAG